MYITSAHLSDVLAWFQSSTRFQFLLLFAAGDSKTATFIGSLFDQKETIDVVSSSQVAVFLFAPKIESAISFHLDGGPNAFLQGMRLDPEPKPNYWQTQLPAHTVSIRSLTDANYKDQIVRASVSATHDLTSELGLGPKDLPAWILFHRTSAEPLIVRTKGQDEIGQLLEFLKDVRQIAFKHVKVPRATATSRRQRLRQSRAHLQDARQQLEHALGQWRQNAGTIPADPTLASTAITPENAIDVLKWPSSSDSNVREIVRQWQRCRSATKSIAHLEMEIQEYTDSIAAAPLALSHNEREVSRLAQKYQALFQLRLIGTKLSGFIRIVTGAGKQAQEMTDIVGKLRKALGDDA